MDTPANPQYRTIPVPTPEAPPLRIELVQGSRWGKWVTRIAVAVAIFSLIGFFTLSAQLAGFLNLGGKLTEKNVRIGGATDESVLSSSKKIAIINVEGAIMHQDGYPKWQIDQSVMTKMSSRWSYASIPRRHGDGQSLSLASAKSIAQGKGNSARRQHGRHLR